MSVRASFVPLTLAKVRRFDAVLSTTFERHIPCVVSLFRTSGFLCGLPQWSGRRLGVVVALRVCRPLKQELLLLRSGQKGVVSLVPLGFKRTVVAFVAYGNI